MDESILAINGGKTWRPELCGNKGHILYRLFQARLNVPIGFAVTWPALRNIFQDAEKQLYTNKDLSETVINEVRSNVEKFDLLTHPIAKKIELSLSDLELDKEAEVIARSSSSFEDSDQAAFPGIFESIRMPLNLFSVLNAIKRVYASRLSLKAVSYVRAFRAMRGMRLDIIQPMAVIVQSYIKGQLGGVLFTVDPMEGDNGRLEITLGGAEGVVQGEHLAISIPFNLALGVDSKDRKRLQALCGSKELSRNFEQELLNTVSRVTSILGPSIDIEWVWNGVDIWVVQARPITKLRNMRQ